MDNPTRDRFSNRIDKLNRRMSDLDRRIGELMTARVEVEESLAALLSQRAARAKKAR